VHRAAAVLAQSGDGELFTELPPSALPPLEEAQPPRSEVVRSRITGVDLRLAERQRAGGRMVLSFFEDAVYTLAVDEVVRAGGFTTLTGRIEELEDSLVALTIGGGQLVVDLIAPQGVFQVRFVTEGVYAIRQIDQSAFPEDTEPLEVTAPFEAADLPALPEAPAVVSADDGSRIDVLVMYTTAARLAAGGVASIQNLVTNAVAVTNQTYAQSGVIQRIGLVGMSETSYVESGDMINSDLPRLRSPSDGFIDNAHTLRDLYKADLVSLIVAYPSTYPYCGVAYQMATVAAWFESSAFSVVELDCAIGNLSFPHELGHNMGARHDWYVDSSTAPYRYSHGHVNAPNRWRTIMSYNNYCSVQGFNCTRIQFWSNPNITYGGAPLGVPDGTCTGGIGCDADNARTLNNTRLTVANFRVASQPTATPTRTSTPTRTPTPTPTFTPTPTPPYTVLLVSDIGGPPDVRRYYATPLATLKATVTIWETGIEGNTEPSAAQMAPYEAVIWYTGDNYSSGTGPSAASEAQLAAWLQAGGCLFLSSQDYELAYRINLRPVPSSFMVNYLGVNTVIDEVGQTSVTGAGLLYGGFGPYNLVKPTDEFAGNFSDTITPRKGAVTVFQGDQGPAAVAYQGQGFKTTYWGFPFEMIPNESDRTAILKRFLRWCRYYESFLPYIKR
jgi:hypothetical protein